MTKETLKFPKGFLWGAATSAYQVEGGNKNDWSEWEKKNAERLAKEAKMKWAKWQQKKFPEMFDPKNYISGRACDHYNRYEEDFDIAKSLGLNAFRISIEWSRIEPEEGKFDEKEIERYRKVLEAIRVRGMEPFVTLWHWTNPIWLAQMGGIECKKFPYYFTRYSSRIVEEYNDLVSFWITLNEPTSIIGASYLVGQWLPQKRSISTGLKIYKILSEAHRETYDAIHKISKSAQVGFSNILRYQEPHDKKSLLDRLATKISIYFTNKKFLGLTGNKNDFLSVQFYFHDLVKISLRFIRKRTFIEVPKKEDESTTDLGWEIYPEGIYHLLISQKKFGLPIYILENGLADAEDKKRGKFIKDHLYWIHKAIQEGVGVRGYFHWSLLDNFEWDKGFWPRFGLVEMNYKTMERKIRSSAWEYAKICKENKLVVE